MVASSSPGGMSFPEAISRFNSNISYSGLLHAVTADVSVPFPISFLRAALPHWMKSLQTLFAENKEKLIKGALSALLDREATGSDRASNSVELEAQFHALRRLVASKAGFCAFTSLPKMRERVGVKVVKSLQRHDDGVTHAAIDMLCALMQV